MTFDCFLTTFKISACHKRFKCNTTGNRRRRHRQEQEVQTKVRLWADISEKETNVASQHRCFLSHGGSFRARHPGRFEGAVVTEAGMRRCGGGACRQRRFPCQRSPLCLSCDERGGRDGCAGVRGHAYIPCSGTRASGAFGTPVYGRNTRASRLVWKLQSSGEGDSEVPQPLGRSPTAKIKMFCGCSQRRGV